MDFGKALIELRKGRMVRRSGWSGRGMFVALHDAPGPAWQPYLAFRTMQGSYVPWVASQTDLLATDWLVIDP